MANDSEKWIDVGAAAELGADGVRKVQAGNVPVASWQKLEIYAFAPRVPKCD